jgi:hypothetical protein
VSAAERDYIRSELGMFLSNLLQLQRAWTHRAPRSPLPWDPSGVCFHMPPASSSAALAEADAIMYAAKAAGKNLTLHRDLRPGCDTAFAGASHAVALPAN